MNARITRTRWVDVCALDDIGPQGVECALVGRLQVAILRVAQGEGEGVYAIDSFDPYSKAYVLARGVVDEQDGVPRVASPVSLRRFSLLTGECLDDPSVSVSVYPVRLREGRVELQVPAITLDSFESMEAVG